MRIAPLAFCVSPETEEGRRLIRDVCRITHHSDDAYAGALAVVLAIRAAAAGQGPELRLDELAAALPPSSTQERLLAYSELPQTVTLAEAAERFGAAGFVGESVPLAIFAARRVGELGFAGMLGQIIAVGGDTDTNASLAGQIAGASLGLERLPGDLLARLPQAEMVMRIAGAFAEALAARH
jgi:ADP-ribosylglycohydrolase